MISRHLKIAVLQGVQGHSTVHLRFLMVIKTYVIPSNLSPRGPPRVIIYSYAAVVAVILPSLQKRVSCGKYNFTTPQSLLQLIFSLLGHAVEDVRSSFITTSSFFGEYLTLSSSSAWSCVFPRAGSSPCCVTQKGLAPWRRVGLCPLASVPATPGHILLL